VAKIGNRLAKMAMNSWHSFQHGHDQQNPTKKVDVAKNVRISTVKDGY
jgi:hypothetical protein